MYTVEDSAVWQYIMGLDTIARSIMGDSISGVSIGVNSQIHVINETPENIATASSILSGRDGLVVNSSVTEMTVGDPDPVIVCNDGSIFADTDIGYVVLFDELLYDSGTDVLVDGSVDLTLVSPEAGEYVVYIYRLVDNYLSGFVTITVNEVV